MIAAGPKAQRASICLLARTAGCEAPEVIAGHLAAGGLNVGLLAADGLNAALLAADGLNAALLAATAHRGAQLAGAGRAAGSGVDQVAGVGRATAGS